MKKADDNYVSFELTDYVIGKNIEKTVTSYKDLFAFIGILLLLSSILLISTFSFESVKRNTYNIGVLKANGMRNKDLYKMYAQNMFLQLLFSVIFYIPFLYLFKYIANELLVASLLKLVDVETMQFTVFNIRNYIWISNMIVIFVSALIGYLIPIIKIKNIRPVEIIKSKY